MSHQQSQSSDRSTIPAEDDWKSVTDAKRRRKIQNRTAQRKSREKARNQREKVARADDNRRNASGAYATLEPEDADKGEEGLPWGSISLRHIIISGRLKEQSFRQTNQQPMSLQAGSSSRVGLHLIDNYARGSSAWAAWRAPLLTSVTAAQRTKQR